MIINCNSRDTRRSIYLDDGLLYQISVIDCILMRLGLNSLLERQSQTLYELSIADYIGFPEFLRSIIGIELK